MSYTPSRISKKDVETDEVEISTPALQRNLYLISKETDELGDRINENGTGINKLELKNKQETRFVKTFLF